MNFEKALIGVMILLVSGILGLIAIAPDAITQPKSTEEISSEVPKVVETSSEPEPIAELEVELEPVAEPELEVELEPMVEPELEVELEPVTEPEPPIPSTPVVVEVTVPSVSGVPGCDETNECFIPYEVSIGVGDELSWYNDDTAAHTVTSGSPSDGPDGMFDSGIFMAETTFSHTFDEAGTFDYFCMVHPWMKGIVQVS